MTGSDRSFRTLLAQAADWAREHVPSTRAGSEPDEEEPLRAALFSSDQMVAHGKLLAGRHRLAKEHRPDRLLARLASNERVLETVARQLRSANTSSGDPSRIRLPPRMTTTRSNESATKRLSVPRLRRPSACAIASSARS